jgi:aspartyl-tRNA(Asn)/glutamyl-tRNA(Gln) amidotransferase subunit B
VSSSKYEIIVGIETHVQLATKSKLFCGCNNDSREAAPNTNVCPVCLGLPGALPVLNGGAVKLALKAGHALNAYEGVERVNSKFDRKNYFYPDSPMNYQITQFDQPIIGPGYVEFPVDGQLKRVGITRTHLEADAGKLVHPAGKDYSLVDLNRAGTPLIEIVSEPDMRSAAEAKAYAQELYNLMRYAGVSDADLYYGNMRFDVNVSLRPVGSTEFGTRTESKNLNSFRAVAGVVEYEAKRQEEILERGEPVIQETRGWDEGKRKTFSQRTKEEAHDYRYFPEPDLPPLVITRAMLDKARADFPPDRHPHNIRAVMMSHGLDAKTAEALIDEPTLAFLYLDAVVGSDRGHHRRIANWLTGEVRAYMQAEPTGPLHNLNKERIVALAEMVESGELSSTASKEVLVEMIKTGKEPKIIALQKKLIQVSDTGELEKIVDQVIADNPGPAEQFRQGEDKVLGFLVGQVMKASKGQANPPMVNDILREKLKR